MSSPYQCPRHKVALVARVLVAKRFFSTGVLAGTFHAKRVHYFACPKPGCNFKKPDKWQNRKRYGHSI